jgi:hypothetical protein
MDAQSLWSDLKLGARAIVVLPLQRLLRQTDGLTRFGRAFFPERLLPTTAEDSERLRESSRCVACGACDAALPANANLSSKPSLLASVHARSGVGVGYAVEDVRWLAARREILVSAEALCPTGVPLERIAGWLISRAAREA